MAAQAGTRTVEFGKPLASFPTNAVKTTKYTAITFAPKNLFEQYKKFGNLYFTLISVLMYLGEHTSLFIGTIKAFSTAGTLAMMMLVTAAISLYDDLRRGKADKEINDQEATLIEGGTERQIKWSEVNVGQVLRVLEGNEFPADMVLVETARTTEGNCFVSTANLDGETNLKQKDKWKNAPSLGALTGSRISAEPPSDKIYAFNGKWEAANAGSSESLGPDQLLLRGTVLRNTAWVTGIVVYTGAETRMVMNSRPAPLKQSNIEKDINKVMYIVLTAQAGMALLSNVLFSFKKDEFRQFWYLTQPHLLLPDWLGYWLTFFVLYSNLMPISLYPSMEFVNLAHSYFIKNDFKMLWRPQAAQPPQPGSIFAAGVKSSNLCQELGQIDYIFSDKTGTLTQNIMEFKYASILGRPFHFRAFSGQRSQAQASAEKEKKKTPEETWEDSKGVKLLDKALVDSLGKEEKATVDNFWEALSVCHTVQISQKQGKAEYEAESPDEKAFVEQAAQVGWELVSRSGQTIEVKTREGRKTYTVKAINAFDSTRKRMSIAVQNDSGVVLLLVKGADNVMLERCNTPEQTLKDHLEAFSLKGLRTLVIGRKVLSEGDFNKWLAKYDEAKEALIDRDSKLAKVADEIEKDLEIVGATAIEDKLQDRVPETIEKVRQAGIKLWVLTGDKLETARNIGFSANVLVPGMNERKLDMEELKTEEALRNELKDIEIKFANAARAFEEEEKKELEEKDPLSKEAIEKKLIEHVTALLVTGSTLDVIMQNNEYKTTLADIAKTCRIVMACRVSPLQKAQMVSLVRDNITLKKGGLIPGLDSTPVTLAIGDGANDVPMIQAAQVGVGIAGREGRQAVNNSDFAIGQFQYLERLLLVHGRWNYRRVSKFALFTFWRNAVQVLMICYYTWISGFSGTSLFEDWVRLSFNFLCSLPIIAVGCFDQDVPEKDALDQPSLYECGRLGMDLNAKRILYTLLSAITHSLILLWVTAMAFPGLELLGAGDYYTFGTAVYSCLILDMTYRVVFISFTHNKYTWGAAFFSIFLYVIYLATYAMTSRTITDIFEPNMWHVPTHIISPPFWIMLIVVPVLAMNADVFIAEVFTILEPYHLRIVNTRRNAQTREQLEAREICEKNDMLRPKTKMEKMLHGVLGYTLHAREQPCPVMEQGLTEQDRKEAEKYVDLSCEAQQIVASHTCSVVRTTMMKALLGTDEGQVWRMPNATPFSFITGTFMFFVGLYLFTSSSHARQIRIHYAGQQYEGEKLFGFPINFMREVPLGTHDWEVIDVTKNCSIGETCRIEVHWPHEKTDQVEDLKVFYNIGPFYQNFNDYLKSEVQKELMGLEVTEAQRDKFCPALTRVTDDGKDIVPCGLKAVSMFNDTFRIDHPHRKIDENTTGWDSDVERYKNPDDYGKRSDTQWLFERYDTIVKKDEGVKNRHFVDWMRPAALWRIWNVYGELKDVQFEKGQKIVIHIENNYPVPPDDKRGYKELVLTTVGRFGGRHHGFAYLLWFTTVCSFLAGAAALRVRGIRNRLDGLRDKKDRAYAPLSTSPESADQAAQALLQA